MAGRDSHLGGTGRILPSIKVKRYQIKKTRNAMKHKAFAKPLTLPSIELLYADLNDVSTLFSKKQLCKKVSEWFVTWRPWQQRILLCNMTEKCSKSQLHALITSLEPVFHRDFVSELRGSYPTNLLRPRFVHTISSLLGDAELRILGQNKDASIVIEDKKTETSVDKTMKKILGQKGILESRKRIPDGQCGKGKTCSHEVASVEIQHVSEEEDITRFAVTPAARVELRPFRRHEHAPAFTKLKKVSTRNFFPDSRAKKLGSMKSALRTGDKNSVFGKDPVSFKCSKWWKGHQGSKLVKPRRSRLAKHFKSQLNQINQVR
jgi:hypothetical protein